ncbi:MAG: NAD(P)/FAD-dependent oxidoreductase [Candidatus Bathyarchaeia archaeon]
MESANVVIVGAGVVGLAVAASVSENSDGVYVFEKNARYGQETSSHNSAVIHSGIHYRNNSLKAKLCVKGNTMLYELCEKYQIPFKRLGKLTVAIGEEEVDELEKLMRMGTDNGVEGLEFLDGEDVRKLEPNVEVEKALLSPSTGIIEPDELMNHFYTRMRKNNAVLATETELQSLKKVDDRYEVGGVSMGEKFHVTAKTVVNCAGLYSDRVAAMAGLDVDKIGYRLYPCKGDYFRVAGKPLVKMLVYPVPKGPGLGIHLTPDLGGSIRLGPNAYYVDKIDYTVESNEKEFREDVTRFVPKIREFQIHEDSSGIRPKLEGPQDGFKDFVIRHEADRGLFGFINLVGIESPGLTAAPAIGELVAEMIESEIKK